MSEALAPRTRASFYNWLDCSIWPTPSSNGRKPTREELARLYFGAGAQRVLELKERWDPENRLGMFCE